jgi:tetratricopeptide (TPR) repeat protein
MAQMKVFVSHSHTNNDFCAGLVQGLKAAGADVWYDEEKLHAGQLGPVIERELRERPVFLVVLSPAALQSRWVEDETRWAYGLLRRDPSRIILPVLAEALPDEGGIWLFLQDFKRVEAPGVKPLPQAEAVARTLHALQLTLPGEAPQPTAPQPDESADDLVTRGNALLSQERYVEALPLYQRATQLAPDSFDAWWSLANTLYKLKRYDEALAAYKEVVDIADFLPAAMIANFLQEDLAAEAGRQAKALRE